MNNKEKNLGVVLAFVIFMLALTPFVHAEAILIDHTRLALPQIQNEWVDVAKDMTNHYAHTSQGNQISPGVENHESQDSRYSIARRASGTEDLPPIEKPHALRMYDGNPSETYRTPVDYWDSGQGDSTIYVNTSGWWIDSTQFNVSSTPIQAAVNNATVGDLIFVYNGTTYTENVIVNKSLTLEGEGADVVTVNAASSSEHIFNVTVDYVNISGFTATGATGDRKTGIYLGNGVDHCNVSYNRVLNSNRGIYLYNSSNNTLVSNIMTGNTYNFGVFGEEIAHYIQNIDTSNTVDGKQVYYWLDRQDQQVPDNAGFVGLVNCKNITVKNLILPNNVQTLLLAYSNDSRIDNISAPNNYFGIHLKYSNNNTLVNNNASENYCGIYLQYSNNNTLQHNIASGNSDYGIYLDNSSSNNITSNTANENGWYGIELYTSSNYNTLASNTANSNGHGSGIIMCVSSDYNTLTNNTANSNGYDSNGISGIALYDLCDYNILTNNTANTNGGYCGILLWSSSRNNLTNNTVNSNTDEYAGIFLYDSSNYNTLASNTVIDNSNKGIRLWYSSSNLIYNNYFNNTNNAADDGINTWNTTNTTGPNIIGGPFIGGNYWSDYTGNDGNGDGFGETAYNITGGTNKDYLPLVHVQGLCGDVDGNGFLNIMDVRLLLNHVNNPEGYPVDPWTGDVNGGGIDTGDVQLLLAHVFDPVEHALMFS